MKSKEISIRISYSNTGPVNEVQYIQLNHFECFPSDGKLFISNGFMEGLAAEKKPQFLLEYTETLNIKKSIKIYQYLHCKPQKKEKKTKPQDTKKIMKNI